MMMMAVITRSALINVETFIILHTHTHMHTRTVLCVNVIVIPFIEALTHILLSCYTTLILYVRACVRIVFLAC